MWILILTKNTFFLSQLITFGILTINLGCKHKLIDMFITFLRIIIMILDNLVMALLVIGGQSNNNWQQ